MLFLVFKVANAVIEDILQFFAGLELDDDAGGDDDILVGHIRVAANSGFADVDLEDAEVAELHVAPVCQSVGNFVEGFLHHFFDFFLRQICALVDIDDDVAFGQVGALIHG